MKRSYPSQNTNVPNNPKRTRYHSTQAQKPRDNFSQNNKTLPVNETSKPPKVVRHFLTTNGASWVDAFSLPKDLLSDIKFQELWDLHPKETGKILMMGKMVSTPRWHQSYGLPYKFSGISHEALPVPPTIQKLLDHANASDYCESYGGRTFNMCLANWYENGSHYIGPHSDDERDMIKNLKNETVVYSISLGQNRQFHLTPKKGISNAKALKLDMPHGTVLVMGGTCQQTHKHSVPKVAGKKGAAMARRINLTFRIFNE